jgi:hypothetical protein
MGFSSMIFHPGNAGSGFLTGRMEEIWIAYLYEGYTTWLQDPEAMYEWSQISTHRISLGSLKSGEWCNKY